MNIRFPLALFVFVLSGCEETIVHNLDEFRANEIKVALDRAGIAATKLYEGSGWAIQVDQNDETRALSVLEASRIIRKDTKNSIDPPKGLIPSKEERAAFSERQLSSNLELTLERLPAVLEARVHLHLDAVDSLALIARTNEYTASVLLVVATDPNVKEITLRQQAQQIISGASGVAESAVSVVIARSETERKAETPQTNSNPLTVEPKGITSKVPPQSRHSALLNGEWRGVTIKLLITLAVAISLMLAYRFAGRKKAATQDYTIGRSASGLMGKRPVIRPQTPASHTASYSNNNAVDNHSTQSYHVRNEIHRSDRDLNGSSRQREVY